ncbi:MAG: hypothetical protein IPO21_15250 [Bacteroidales bacterium]|nr:hypothetical protein [Bacteroidales bacterium]
MKNSYLLKVVVGLITLVSMSTVAFAQEEAKAEVAEESKVSIDGGLDIYSSYVWRGSKFGKGPAFQPWVEGAFGNLAIGGWGSVNAGSAEAFEMDTYISYSFDFGLGITVSDYFFGDSVGLGYLDFKTNHYIEPSLSYEIKAFTFTGAYMFLPGFSNGGDMYFEAEFSKGAFSFALGAGNGQYTSAGKFAGDFMLCNVKIGASKELQITEKYAIPLSAAVIFNPATEGFFIAAGISF